SDGANLSTADGARPARLRRGRGSRAVLLGGGCCAFTRLRRRPMMGGVRGEAMAEPDLVGEVQDVAESVQGGAPLGAVTVLEVGGPAEVLVQPRNVEELSAVVRRCGERGLPLRLLGSGCGVLVRDEGVRAVVIRLSGGVFQQVTVQGGRVRAGGGAALSALISE